jgi:GTP cyclohydrolase I
MGSGRETTLSVIDSNARWADEDKAMSQELGPADPFDVLALEPEPTDVGRYLRDLSEAEHRSVVLFQQILVELGIWDPQNEHQTYTPHRFVRAFAEMTTPTPFEFTTFPNEGLSEMVVVGPIRFTSLCAHHILPFFGDAYVAYIPSDRIAGLSKLGRVVVETAKGLYVQEELTAKVSNILDEELDPLGSAVVMQAEHLCMSVRGLRAPGARTVTSSMKGVFLHPEEGKDPKGELMGLINNGH